MDVGRSRRNQKHSRICKFLRGADASQRDFVVCLEVSSSIVVLLFLARKAIRSLTRSVSVQPGRMELKRIFSFPSSNARDLVKPTVAARILFERTRLGSGCLTVYEVNVKHTRRIRFPQIWQRGTDQAYMTHKGCIDRLLPGLFVEDFE